MIKEYRDLKPSEYAVKTVLKTVGKYSLYHLSKGFECAGSCARLQEYEVWGYSYMLDGATHGKRFLTESEALQAFTTMINRNVAKYAVRVYADMLSAQGLNVSKVFQEIGNDVSLMDKAHFERGCLTVTGNIDASIVAAARELVRDFGIGSF